MDSSIVYAPIIKWKAGERIALQELEPERKSKIAPVVELIDYDEPTSLLEDLGSLGGPLSYVDTSYVDNGDRDLIARLCEQARRSGVTDVIPVFYHEDLASGDRRVFLENSERFLVRVPVPVSLGGSEFEDTAELLQLCCREHDRRADLLLDMGVLADRRIAGRMLAELKQALTCLAHVAGDKIYIAVSCFPESLGDLAAGDSIFHERFELDVYHFALRFLEGIGCTELRRRIAFSDYGVAKFTDTDIDFSLLRYGVLPKTRYTTRTHYWIQKGKKDRLRDEWIRSYRHLAKSIFESEHFFGEDFSYGDSLIHKKARKIDGEGPGNHMNWITIGTNHHIAVVMEQLAKLDVSSVPS